MSFQFSQNLLADIESSQSQGASLTQKAPSSQNQMDFETQSQSLLDTSSNPQFNQFPNNQSIPRAVSQVGPNLGRGPVNMSRLDATRFHAPPDRVNVELAQTLKNVHSSLEEFPVKASRMLEEGLEYIKVNATQGSEACQTKASTLKGTLQALIEKLSEKDKNYSDFTERFLKELQSITEDVHKMKEKQKSYEQLIEQLCSVIEKQAKVIEKLKSNSIQAHDNHARKEESLPYSNLKVRDFARSHSPKRLLPILSTPSSSESVRKFIFKPKDDVLIPLDITFSDTEEEDILVDSSVDILENSNISLISVESDNDDEDLIIEE